MRILLVALVMLVQATFAQATTLIYKNVDDLVSEADGIVVGTVQSAVSHYGPGNEIYSFITLNRLDNLYGEYNRDALVIRQKGGEVDGGC